MSDAVELEAGTMVDHFRLMRLIGRGGMGEVYLARDTVLGRKVALKVISAARADTPEAREQLLVEARAIASLSHPHIVQIYAVGEHEGAPYVALEYLEGHTLRERLGEEQPGLREALRLGLALAELGAFRVSYCDLMSDVWQEVPVVWEGGLLRRRDPPAAHPCAR